MKKVKDKHYLTNKELIAEIRLSKEKGRLTTKATNMFMLLGKNTIKKMYYSNPDDRDDCYQTGIMQLLLNWNSFNEERSTNAFAYYTEIFKRGIAKGWNEIYSLKGDLDKSVKLVSFSSSNDGDGLYSL